MSKSNWKKGGDWLYKRTLKYQKAWFDLVERLLVLSLVSYLATISENLLLKFLAAVSFILIVVPITFVYSSLASEITLPFFKGNSRFKLIVIMSIMFLVFLIFTSQLLDAIDLIGSGQVSDVCKTP